MKGLSKQSFAELQQAIELAINSVNSTQEDNSDTASTMASRGSDSEQVAATSSSDNTTDSTVCTSDSERKVTYESDGTITVEITPLSDSDLIIVDLTGQEHLLAMDTEELEIILTIEDKATVTDLPMGDEEDDGNISDATTIPFEYDQDVKDAISIGTSITCPENKTVIIDEYGISAERCAAGIIHPKTNPTIPKCTTKNNCKIQLHQAEGILCKAHIVHLSKYRESIEFALMTRITKSDSGCYRQCMFCPGRFNRGNQTLSHVRGHGGELGYEFKFPMSVTKALDSITPSDNHNDNICDDCYEEHETPHGLQLHRVIQHYEYSDDPLVCPICRHSLYDESLDLHWSQYHDEDCCGTTHNTFGEQIKHYMHYHPRKLDTVFCKSDLSRLYRTTRDNPRTIELPWGRATRIFSTRITGALLSIRVNDAPKPRSAEFRQLYKTGPSYNIGRDLISKLTHGWYGPPDLRTADSRSILVWTEISLIKNIGKMLEKYLEQSYMHAEVPVTAEFRDTDFDDWCHRCQMQVDHPESSLCVNKRQYASVTHAFLAGQLEDNLINMYAGVLIGAEGHWYGTGPVGQFALLNLSMEGWEPQYPTGILNGQEIVFRKGGKHEPIPVFKDYFLHVKSVAEQLPRSYGKPIILEFFLMREEDQTEEEIECQVEAYFESLNQLRLKYPFLYAVLGTVVDFRDMVDYTEATYKKASRKLELINNMAVLYATKYQIPFMPTQGIINSRRSVIFEQELWSYSADQNREELVDTHAFLLREFHRRFGTVIDLLLESFQKTVTQIIHLTEPEIRPVFTKHNVSVKGKNHVKNKLKKLKRKAKKRLLKAQNTSGISPTLGNTPTISTEPVEEASTPMADLQEVLENSTGRTPLAATSGEHMEKRDLPENG